MGHSTIVASKHYWQVTDEDYQRAAAEPTGGVVQNSVQLGSQPGAFSGSRAVQETQENAVKDGKSERKRLPRLDSNQESLIQSQVVFH